LEADRVLLEHLRAGDYDTWRDVPLEQLEASGQHEVLNWMCLAGAMAETGAKMELVDWVETWIFNAPKCQAIFRRKPSTSPSPEARRRWSPAHDTNRTRAATPRTRKRAPAK